MPLSSELVPWRLAQSIFTECSFSTANKATAHNTSSDMALHFSILRRPGSIIAPSGAPLPSESAWRTISTSLEPLQRLDQLLSCHMY